MSEQGFVNLRGTKEKRGAIGSDSRGRRILLASRSAFRALPRAKYIDVADPRLPDGNRIASWIWRQL